MDASREHVTMLGGVAPNSKVASDALDTDLAALPTTALRALTVRIRRALWRRTSEFAVRQRIKGGLDKIFQVVLLFKFLYLRTGSFASGPAACKTGLHHSAHSSTPQVGSGGLLTFLRSPLVPGFCPSNGLVSRIVQARCLLMLT